MSQALRPARGESADGEPPAAPRTHRVLGVPFFTGGLDEAIERSLSGHLVIAPSGPNLAGELRTLPAYRKAVLEADLVITDSSVMVTVFRLVTGIRLPRHSGLMLIGGLVKHPALKRPGAAFWIMPSEEEGGRIGAWLASQGIPIGPGNCHTAPFYTAGAIEDPQLLQLLERARPEVIIINLAGGKQEVLGAWLRERLSWRPGIVCTGAAIAFLAGTQARIPDWADRLGLGWLARCAASPAKFIPRYWRALPLVALIARWRERLPPPLFDRRQDPAG